MNIQQIASYLHRPQNLDMNSINELEALVSEYPFFNGARILLARACKNEEDHRFGKYLKAAALYAGDRKRLFHYLETDASALTELPQQEEVQNELKQAHESPQSSEIEEITFGIKREAELPEEKYQEPEREEEGPEEEKAAEDIVYSEERIARNEKTDRDNAEFVLRNLDDWEDVVYEEHSEHKSLNEPETDIEAKEQARNFEEKAEEIREPDQRIDKLKDLPADEAVDPAFGAGSPETENSSIEEIAFKINSESSSHHKTGSEDVYGDEELHNKTEDEASSPIVEKEQGEKLQPDTAIWENESFPEEIALSETTGLDEELNEEEPEITPKPGEKYRFEEWLSALQVISRLEKKEADEMEAAEAERKKENEKRAEQLTEKQEVDPKAGTREIIERFLQEEPSISKPHTDFFKPRNMAKQSEQFHEDEWATETLASIYAKQGHIDRAIRIYEKLILQMPDKKAYFASLIEELNKKR